MDRAEALRTIPVAYAVALRLRDAGMGPDLIARVLDIDPASVGPLLEVADAKLAGALDAASPG